MTDKKEYLSILSGAHVDAVYRAIDLEKVTAFVLVSYAKFIAAFDSVIADTVPDEESVEDVKVATGYLIDLYERIETVSKDLDALVNKIKPRQDEGD